jgi:hypothetical protein
MYLWRTPDSANYINPILENDEKKYYLYENDT